MARDPSLFRLAGGPDHDQGARERHGDAQRTEAGFTHRDSRPARDLGRDVAASAAPSPSDAPAPPGTTAHAEEVGYLDRGSVPSLDEAAEGSHPADDADPGPYSGLEGTGPQPDDGRAGQTNTAGLPTALSRQTPPD